MRSTSVMILLLLGCSRLLGQEAAVWRDPSPHKVQFITVEPGVTLEVLDWGGSGRAVVLLAGSGNTAHVFDEFAPKLTGRCRVYGITRRGYGVSSQPASGYDDQRLADDVLHVLDALRVPSPVLAGHSMAGGELTTLGNQHSDRLAGLVYLDALGDPRDWTASDPAYMALVKKLTQPKKAAPARPTPTGPESFEAFRTRLSQNMKFAFPESELRNAWATNPDGSRGNHKTPRAIHNAIGEGQKKRDYSSIRLPVLAFLEMPRVEAPMDPEHNEEERAAVVAFRKATLAFVERWIANLKRGVPEARLVDLPGAEHFVFITREAEVLKGIRDFVAGLK